MQVMFLALFGVSLVLFSFLVRQAVTLLPYLIEGEPVPARPVLQAVGWLALFVVSFLGTGFFLYEGERDEGRVSRRIPIYDWLLDRRKPNEPKAEDAAKAIRRA